MINLDLENMECCLMENSMWEYINSQSSILKNILNKELQQLEDLIMDIDMEQVERILFVGSGTSYNVGIAVKFMFEDLLKKEIRVEYPFPLRKYSTLLNNENSESTLVIAISQSGKSIGTIECLKMAKSFGMKIVCLTSNIDSDITKEANYIIPILCGDEKVGPKTKGYTTTLLTLQIIALCLSKKMCLITCEDYDKNIKNIAEALNKIDKVVKVSNQWVKNNSEWSKASGIYIVGYGSNLGTAFEGGLKLMETIRKPICPFDIEEYIHGPYNAIDKDTHIIFINSGYKGDSEMKKVVNFLKDITDKYLVINFEDDNNNVEYEYQTISIPKYEEYISPLLAILPFQVIASEIPKLLGINPGIPRYTNFHDIMGSKKGLVDFN
jgi:glucoselysine-6-phosphate deglycase